MPLIVFIRGGGDLASGVAIRLHRAGLHVIIAELPQPLVVRRLVSFAEAVYRGEFIVEGIMARCVSSIDQALSLTRVGIIPLVVDPLAELLPALRSRIPLSIPIVLVDARMIKKSPGPMPQGVALFIGLGPGFVAGENCHAVIETQRGHWLGRVYWHGKTQQDTGIPDPLLGYSAERVLRSPTDGLFTAQVQIGDHVEKGQVVAQVAGQQILAPFSGVVRGLLHPGLTVWKGMKVGDLDPRDDVRYCTCVSEKSLAIGGGVLEALLSSPNLRPFLWDV